MKICPSIASSNLLDIKDEISFVDKMYGNIHIDIEDGNYIPNITFGTRLMELICNTSKSLKSIHLMVTSPESYIDSIIRCNPEVVFIHLDNCRFPSRIIRKFQDSKVNVGIAINPNVAVSDINYVLPLVKNILIMMCEPDGRNQEYLKSMENKIIEIADFKNIRIWVDGGISFDKLPRLEELNVSSVVMGRAIFQNYSNL